MTEDELEALACAMALAPVAWSRNRMFALYKEPEVRRARARARAMRALARELAGRMGAPADVALAAAARGALLTFRVPSVRMGRSAELTHAELACVAHLVAALGGAAPWAPEGARQTLDAALARLPGELRRP